MGRTTFAGLSILLSVSPAWAQDWPPPEEPLLEWTDLQFPPDEYEARREAALEALRTAGGGLLMIPSGDGVTHGATFRQEDAFNYFVGLELPRTVLVLDAQGGAGPLFLPARDTRFDNPSRRNDFPGRRLRDDPRVVARADIPTRPAGDFDAYLDSLAAAGARVWVDGGRPGPLDDAQLELPGGLEARAAFVLGLRMRHPDLNLENAYGLLSRLRMVKSPSEVQVLRRAAEVTAGAIRHAARFVGAGVDERTLEGEFELACKRGGSQRLAFSSIVKSGPNSLWPWRVLAAHYDRRNRAMESGDLVIFDVGCEVDYYASDVGRTFPVSGRFSDRQRRALELSTSVADAIIGRVRPGVTFAELLEVARARIPEAERRHMQTGSFFGHHVGLAVGDPALSDVPLEAGMVFTVEPWYYNHEEGVAVFVEDMVLVTDSGAEILSNGLPRDPASLEAMVDPPGPGPQPLQPGRVR